jgi:hypothetical protein
LGAGLVPAAIQGRARAGFSTELVRLAVALAGLAAWALAFYLAGGN